ncbi:MAG TPA: tRNA (adenosine(37)-N6)-dimethylallyltransferase MiaA [Gemmatimonadales bacterium]|nr:tRNA (adenosine(37)-N6)-dimethylallyltransferase MiaA [Gemmatimonadales bacterium]
MGAAKRWVPVIVGPTAVGKTAVAAALARVWPVTVISADSRQVYRGLDIGTAKPEAALRAKVPHVGIDLVDPGERYSAGHFARDAARWLAELPAERQPVVVGGTGFYVRALADGLFREPPLDPQRRDALRSWLRDLERVGGWAARLDPGYTAGGRQRAARAVEIALLSGRPLSWWQAHAKAEGVIEPWYVRLTVPRAVLHQRIEARLQRMLAAGWIDEVRAALARGIAAGAPGLDAVGYREIVRHLAGDLPSERLAGEIAAATRRYAKRQETWFRHQLVGYRVLTLDATDAPAALARTIVARWRESNGER